MEGIIPGNTPGCPPPPPGDTRELVPLTIMPQPPATPSKTIKMIMRKLVSKSFVVLSLLYLQVNGIIFGMARKIIYRVLASYYFTLLSYNFFLL